MSEKAHLDAVVALLTAEDARPFTLQQLKDLGTALPEQYNEVQVAQRFGSGPRRAGAPSAVTQWRVLVRSVAKKYGNAQEMRKRADAALQEAKVTVGGEDFFIERSVSDDPIGEDDGWWSGVSEFAY
jgi:ribosomal protein L7/L12